MRLINRFARLTLANQANVLFGSIVTLATLGNLLTLGLQYGLAKREAEASTAQTDQLISAADRNADSARRFAEAAAGINKGVSSAAERLRDQAIKMDAARLSSEENSARALQATIDNFHQEQRAWVGIGNSRFTMNASDPVEIVLSLVNTGKTPARDVESRIGLASFPKGREVTMSDVVYATAASQSGTLYPTGSTVIGKTLDKTMPGQDTEIATIQKGDELVYVFAFVTYKDIFDKPHWTQFCGRLTENLKEIHLCSIYNDSN